MNPYDAPMPDRIDRLAKRVDDLEHRLVSLAIACCIITAALMALAVVALT